MQKPIPKTRRRSLSLLACAFAVSVGGCSSDAPSAPSGAPAPAISNVCAELLADAESYVRDGRTSESIMDFTLEEMSVRCTREYETFVEEVSETAAQRALQEAGPPLADPMPTGAISWSEAIDYVGSTQYVCGPLASIRNSTDDVFLNIGLDHPHPSRFTIVLWDVGGVEPVPINTTICAEGPLTSYENVAQMQLRSAGAVEIWE